MLKRLGLVLIFSIFSMTALARVKIGDNAPDFGQRSIFDSTKELWVGDMIGPEATQGHKALLIVFAASYCKPCWKELPDVIRIREQFAGQGLEVLYVIADMEARGWAKARKRLKAAGVTFPCARLRVSTMGNKYLGKTWNLPAMFVINSKGRVAGIFHVLDTRGLKSLKTLIKNLVGGKK